MPLIVSQDTDMLLLVPGLVTYDRDTGQDVPLDGTATVELTITTVDDEAVAGPLSGLYVTGSAGDFTVLLPDTITWPASGQALCTLVIDNGADQHAERSADIVVLPLMF